MGDVGRITLATHLVFAGNSQCERTHRATSYSPLSRRLVSIILSGRVMILRAMTKSVISSVRVMYRCKKTWDFF